MCVLVQALTDYMSKQLEGRVSKVAVSARLTDSPCILVTSKSGWSANMQRIMKSQPMQDGRALDYMKGDKIMEINPENAVRCPRKYSPIARILGPSGWAWCPKTLPQTLVSSQGLRIPP